MWAVPWGAHLYYPFLTFFIFFFFKNLGVSVAWEAHLWWGSGKAR